MTAHENIIKATPLIESKLNYCFRNKSLLALSFVHRSYINENRTLKEHNERLEFLGDSVLGLLIAEYLYLHLPKMSEGELSYLRSRLVEASSCMTFVQKLDLGQHLLLGRGEQMNDGRGRESILADLFEAIIGAIYLDGGIEAARRFLFDHFSEMIEAIIKTPVNNWKALLQDLSQKDFQKQPLYKVLEESGPDHSKKFIIAVYINEQKMGQGEGSSKKEAQQAAAEEAFKSLEKTLRKNDGGD